MEEYDEELPVTAPGTLVDDSSQRIITENIKKHILSKDFKASSNETSKILAEGFADSLSRSLHAIGLEGSLKAEGEAMEAGKQWTEAMDNNKYPVGISAEALVEMTLPTPYTPPEKRFMFADRNYDGLIKIYNDCGDTVAAPIFQKITENLVRGRRSRLGVRDGKPLRICCTCTDGCGASCECRDASKRVHLEDGELVVNEGQDYCIHSMHVYVCSSACGCSADCGNRIELKENADEFEVVRRNPRMGYEVRSLRGFRQGEAVMEFCGEIVENVTDEREMEWSFLIFTTRKDARYPKKWMSEWHFHNRGNSLLDLDEKAIYISPYKKGGMARFVCHSRLPNSLPIRVYQFGDYIGMPRLYFFAWLPIAPGDFVTVDYGGQYHDVLVDWCPCDDGASCSCELGCACDEMLCHDTQTLAAINRESRDEHGRIDMDGYPSRVLVARMEADRLRMLRMEMEAIEKMNKKNLNETIKEYYREGKKALEESVSASHATVAPSAIPRATSMEERNEKDVSERRLSGRPLDHNENVERRRTDDSSAPSDLAKEKNKKESDRDRNRPLLQQQRYHSSPIVNKHPRKDEREETIDAEGPSTSREVGRVKHGEKKKEKKYLRDERSISPSSRKKELKRSEDSPPTPNHQKKRRTNKVQDDISMNSSEDERTKNQEHMKRKRNRSPSARKEKERMRKGELLQSGPSDENRRRHRASPTIDYLKEKDIKKEEAKKENDERSGKEERESRKKKEEPECITIEDSDDDLVKKEKERRLERKMEEEEREEAERDFMKYMSKVVDIMDGSREKPGSNEEEKKLRWNIIRKVYCSVRYEKYDVITLD